MESHFDSRQLRAFVTLVRTRNYTQAAKSLFLTQSAVSHSLKALERDVGCPLLHKSGKKIHLTEAGEALFTAAEDILERMDRTRDLIADLGEWGGGRLRIGAGSTPCRYILPTVLCEFRECFPKCQIRLLAGDTPTALDMLRDNEIDLAFCLEPPSSEGARFHPLFRDEMQYVLSPMHEWAARGKIIRSQLPEQQFILYQRNSFTYRLIARSLRESGVNPRRAIELGSIEAIKELLKISLGISILAPWVAAAELEEGSLTALPMGRQRIQRSWGLAYAKDRRLRLAEETFLGLCEAGSQGPVHKHGGMKYS